MWRCSQPMGGVNGKNLEDEKLFEIILALNRKASPRQVVIYDCRPKINANVNKIAGKGFENMLRYKQCKLRFMNIENIHVMRDAYRKLEKAIHKQISDGDDCKFLSSVSSSNWLSHLSEVLKATLEMVISVDRDKGSLVCHCSDGWDRTSQLMSLAQLCLDPYYRTTKGFFVLIEKEWLSFGHKFHERTGHGQKVINDQRAPIFLQWCDAVYQLTIQFPRHFQFNSCLLATLMSHVYSCRFGTFLFDCENERAKVGLKDKTFSLWTYLLCSPSAVAGHFTNPLYSPTGDDTPLVVSRDPLQGMPLEPSCSPRGDENAGDSVDWKGEPADRQAKAMGGAVLYPCWSLKKVVLWSDYFLQWNTNETHYFDEDPGGNIPPYGAATTVLVSNSCLLENRIRELEAELVKSRRRIRELEGEANGDGKGGGGEKA